MSCPSTSTSPRLMPMRNSIRCSGGVPLLRSAIARCTSTAQRTASTTLANSAKKPSPVFFTIRPRYSPIFGLTNSRRWAWSRSWVPSSFAPIRREYPATSAARIAARRRTVGIVRPARGALNQIYSQTRDGPSAQMHERRAVVERRLPCNRLFPNRAVERQVVARDPRRSWLFLDRHRRYCPVWGDLRPRGQSRGAAAAARGRPMSSLFRVELLAVADEYLVGQIHTVAVAFY